MKKTISTAIVLLILVFCFGGCGGNGGIITNNTSGAVNIDFSQKDGSKTQFIKKFDSFSSTWAFVGDVTGSVRQTSLDQLSALQPLKAESMRFDLFMGYTGLGYEIGRNGNSGTTDAEYLQVMQVMNALKDNNVLPYIMYFASPEYTQEVASWKATPNLDRWETLCGNIAKYLKDNDVRLGGHEIWNEPDYGVFFNGSWLDYIDMYIYGARGIRNANPDALVGGVSAAFIDQCCNKKVTEFEDGTKTDFERFVERSAAADMLPDFVSWHYYGRGGVMEGLGSDAHNFSDYRYSVMNALEALQNGTDENVSGAYPELETVQQHLNEFNIYAPSSDEIYRTTGMIPGMFSAIDTILNANDITRATWAGLLCEWQNELSYDMIDTVSLQRYPSYHVLWMYGRLPIDRVKQTAIDNIGTLAGIDDGRAGIVAYNKDSVNRSKKISVGNIPFDSADVTVYLVDDNHFTYATKNEPQIVAEMKNVNPNGLAFNLDFNGNSVYYIEINDSKAKSDTEIMRPLSNNIVKKEYWYPKRGDNTPYSDIHENSLTAHLSMNNNVSGASAMSVVMDDMQGVGTLKVGYETWGDFKRTDTSALGIKVDYQTSGGYTKSVYYYYDDYGYDVVLPFGTKRTADLSESFGSASEGEFEIALEENAPEDWTGRICVNYLIKDSGSTSTAKFVIK